MKRILSFYFSVVVLVFLFSTAVSAQGTAFSYQGSLNTSGTPASGNHLPMHRRNKYSNMMQHHGAG